MKILLIVDQFDNENNGTTISTVRFASVLCAHGNEVRVVSTGRPDPEKFAVDEWKIPLVTHIFHSQGMTLARPDKQVLKDALQWADLAHFLLPLPLGVAGLRLAEEMGVPHTAAFHMQPENVTYNIGLSRFDFLSDFLYRFLRNIFYSRFTHIHCPSQFIAGELERHGYGAKLHVISNGVDPVFCYGKAPKPDSWKDKFVILSVGRLSKEKRQDLLIEAVGHSKYKDRIQLVFAGSGPKRARYEKMSQTLPNRPVFTFLSKEELVQTIHQADLYVHPADAEIEAISCIEAFAGGLVPVIANSKKSATPQFALDERSLFAAGDSTDLARKIDYWLENEAERKEMERVYSKCAQKYKIDCCVDEIERMFESCIKESATEMVAHPVQ